MKHGARFSGGAGRRAAWRVLLALCGLAAPPALAQAPRDELNPSLDYTDTLNVREDPTITYEELSRQLCATRFCRADLL
jgi:hypothetical protein